MLVNYKLQKWLRKFRSHQEDAVHALQNKDVGQCISPTGTGKTWSEQRLIFEDMIQKNRGNEYGVYVIIDPRLVLSNQLITQYIERINEFDFSCNFLYVGSENYKFEGVRSTSITKSTTDLREILEIQEMSKNQNRHLIIVSTIHSSHLLRNLDKIDIAIFDEEHRMVARRFRYIVGLIRLLAKRCYFFTATPKRSQIDDEIFGKVCYFMSPREAIESYEIVKPYIHYTEVSGKHGEISPNRINYIMLTVWDCFEKHSRYLLEKSDVNRGVMAPKLLVAMNGRSQILQFLEDGFAQCCYRKNVRLFAITSYSVDPCQYTDREGNLISCSKQDFVKELNRMKDDERAIILHHDILTEGIDLPNITGLLLLRKLNLEKLLQNLGRVLRLYKTDRYNLYNNLIPKDRRYMIKPYGFIILPLFLGLDYCKEMVDEIRNSYEMIVVEDSLPSSTSPPSSSIPPDIPETEKYIELAETDILIHYLEQLEDEDGYGRVLKYIILNKNTRTWREMSIDLSKMTDKFWAPDDVRKESEIIDQKFRERNLLISA